MDKAKLKIVGYYWKTDFIDRYIIKFEMTLQLVSLINIVSIHLKTLIRQTLGGSNIPRTPLDKDLLKNWMVTSKLSNHK